MTTDSAAILLFTHDSENEIKNKLFLKGGNSKKNKTIADCLISDSIKKISGLGIPYFIVSTKDQKGNTFGERLSNAVESIFESGFNKIIVTGSDIPSITTSTLINASNELKHNDFVIGPTLNGGTYLIGLSKKHFNKNDFQNLNWQTSTLLTEIIDFAKGITSSVVITNPLNDINNPNDLIHFVEHKSKYCSLARTIASLISQSLYSCIFQESNKKISIPLYSFGTSAPPVI